MCVGGMLYTQKFMLYSLHVFIVHSFISSEKEINKCDHPENQMFSQLVSLAKKH